MAPSTIAIIIMVIALILYATEWIPLEATAILSAIAMYVTGITEAGETLSGFSNVALILAVGATMMGNALMQTGALDIVGRRLGFLTKVNKRVYTSVLCGISIALSACMSSFAIIVIMMAVADSLVLASNGKFTRKESYFPIAVGASIGGAISLSGSGSILAACTQYNDAVGFQSIGYFGPAILAIPASLVGILFYATFGTKLSEKILDFDDVPFSEEEIAKAKAVTEKGTAAKNPKLWISLGIFIVCALLWCFSDFDMGLIALGGCAVCLIFRCVKPREFDKCNWNALIILATSLGFAAGFHKSGADAVIADALIHVFGRFGQSPMVMFFVVLLLTTILTNIISNSATAAICAPIAMMLAQNVGMDAKLWVIAVGVCSNVAIFTPIGCSNMTIILKGGYRFKDFVKIGVPITIMAWVIMMAVFAIAG